MYRVSQRLLSTPANLHVIKSAAQYEALKLKSRALVGYFTAGFSTPSKLYESQFSDFAASNPQHIFTCDIDEAPTVAYDCEVSDVPSVSVLPLGSKPDGSIFDKSDMVTIKADETLDYGNVVSRGKQALDSMPLSGEDSAPRKPWRFDPATGTTVPPLAS